MEPEILKDPKPHYTMPSPEIGGWMHAPELEYLFQLGRKHGKILEMGSWFGRSTHALCSGQLTRKDGGTVYAVDHFKGNPSEQETEHKFAAEGGDVYGAFMANCGHFPNLKVMRMDSGEAAAQFEDGSLDSVFLDGDHMAPSVIKDIETWWPKVRVYGSLCGHDLHWPGVQIGLMQHFGIFPHSLRGGTIWEIMKLKQGRWRDALAGNGRPVILLYDIGAIPHGAIMETINWLHDEPRNIEAIAIPARTGTPLQVFDMCGLPDASADEILIAIEERLIVEVSNASDI